MGANRRGSRAEAARRRFIGPGAKWVDPRRFGRFTCEKSLELHLAQFIVAQRDAILAEWTAFARANQPADRNLSEIELRDHAAQILGEIVADMVRPEPAPSNAHTAIAEGAAPDAGGSKAPARAHAMQRARNGFEITQMVAEYRALRATILRLWVASHTAFSSHDVEDLTRFNEAVDEALAESLKYFLAEVDHARDLFLGVLGHDLRGPLSIIASCAQLEQRSRPGDPTSKATVTLRSVAHMKALLDDLVEYARNRLGAKVAIQPVAVELERFTRDAIEEILAIHPERVIDLDATGNLHGHFDMHRLHQVVANLLFNALKYGDASQPIAVRLDGRSADEVVLAVQSIGPAIAVTALPTLFDPLVRGDADAVAWQASGANMGLGLYAAREIVTAHGGVIGVTSSDEDGTRFEVRLPRGATGTIAVSSR